MIEKSRTHLQNQDLLHPKPINLSFSQMNYKVEASFVEVVQLIAGMKLASFLTPDIPDIRWHRFLTPCLASKSF